MTKVLTAALQQSSAHHSRSVVVYTEIGTLSKQLQTVTKTLKKQVATLWDFKYNLDTHQSSPQLVNKVIDRVMGQLKQQVEAFAGLERQAATAREEVSVPSSPCRRRSLITQKKPTPNDKDDNP